MAEDSRDLGWGAPMPPNGLQASYSVADSRHPSRDSPGPQVPESLTWVFIAFPGPALPGPVPWQGWGEVERHEDARLVDFGFSPARSHHEC